MLEEFMNVMTDNANNVEEELKFAEVKNLIDGLEMFESDKKMLTNAYTDILCSDNAVYLLTRISQHPLFMQHFPEFYEKNENGESVINCQQNSPYHRYGVFRHILYTIEYVGQENLNFSKNQLKILKWTMLLHDIGKPRAKTTNLEGKDSFAGHDEISVEMASEILNRFYFTEEEKKMILTLIKYHDRYLNEGELTYDNLSFLAQELDNKKQLFDMIIEVKLADNKAKSIAVYNKFLTVVPKYIEFKEDYFGALDPSDIDKQNEDLILDDSEPLTDSDDELIVQTEKAEEKKSTNKTSKKEEKTKVSFEDAYNNILHGNNIEYEYYPVIDAANACVLGYELCASLDGNNDFSEIFKIAKEQGKYEKINQLISLNLMESWVNEKKEKESLLIVKMDLKSFVKYNNKSRIYDILDKEKIVVLLENYDYSNVTDINKICKEIKTKHGLVGLADFQNSTFTIKELANINTDYVEIKYGKQKGKEQEIIDFCLKNSQKVWVSNVKSKKDFLSLRKMNVDLFSGKFIFGKKERPDVSNAEVEKFLDLL